MNTASSNPSPASNVITRSLVVLLLAVAACGGSSTASAPDTSSGGSSGDPTTPAPTTPPHQLTVKWSLKKADGTPNGATDACPANYGTVKVSAQAVDSLDPPYSFDGDPFEAKFDCAAGTGTIELPTSGDQDPPPCFGGGCSHSRVTDNKGKYFVTLHITEASGEVEQFTAPLIAHASEVMPKTNVDMTSGDQIKEFTFWPGAGFLLYNWSLTTTAGAELSCASSGVDSVKLTGTLIRDQDNNDVANGAQFVDTYPCTGDPTIEATTPGSVAAGSSRPLAKGTYHFAMEAFAAGVKVGERDMSVGEGGVNDVLVAPQMELTTSFEHSFDLQISNR